MRVKLFADGAENADIVRLCSDSRISGFTTNPTLMRKAGVTDYEAWAKDILSHIGGRPISFEVLADYMAGMEHQALKISEWGDNVYVKVPVTNSAGIATYDLVNRLARQEINLNVTAVMTTTQVRVMNDALEDHAPSCISIFAGRIADTGVDPMPLIRYAVALCETKRNQEIIWASPRELLNVIQADEVGCHIITATPDILKKLDLIGKNLAEYSLETVKMFRDDAVAAGYSL